jgi:hypothetical protein
MLKPKDFLNRGAKVIIYAVKKKADITIPVEQLASHLKNLNVKTIIVMDKSFFFDDVIKALKLKESPIADRVSLNIFLKKFMVFKYCKTNTKHRRTYQKLDYL